MNQMFRLLERKADIGSFEAVLTSKHKCDGRGTLLEWVMTAIPELLLYGELANRKRNLGGQKL